MPGISAFLDSDTENATSNFIDENSLISSVSEDTLAPLPPKKAAAKPRKRKCVTMPKKPRAKANPKADAKAQSTNSKRKATERKVEPSIEEEVEADEVSEDELATMAPPEPRTKANKPKKVIEEEVDDEQEVQKRTAKPRSKTSKVLAEKDSNAKVAKARPHKKVSKEVLEDVEEEVLEMRSNFTQNKAARSLPKPVPEPRAKPASKRPAKTSSKALEVYSDEEVEEEGFAEPEPPRKKIRTQNFACQEPSYCRRAGSASDTERGDPMLRRKLGDMTRKCETVEVKYRTLKDVAVGEANANVEKLRRQCETITEASDKLIASLKKQITQQTPLNQESQKLKKTIQTHEKTIQAHEAETSRLRGENNSLSAELSASRAEIAAARAEIKALQSKLTAARATPAPESKLPIVKAVAKTPAVAQSQSVKESQLKIDLYSDLTGLIVNSVKQSDEGDTYDCIQTGRNGTLHFKLFVDSDNARKVSFEETEFLYSPQLDLNRDRDLIEIMPDYLTEDITFVREVAAKFYARVVKTLTEKPVEEEVE